MNVLGEHREVIECTERGKTIDFLQERNNSKLKTTYVTAAPVLCFKLWSDLTAGTSVAIYMLVKRGQYNKISVYTIKSQYMQQDVHIYNIISISTTRFLYIQQVFIIYNEISIYTTSFHYIQQEFYIYNMMCMYTTFPICTTRII